MLSSHLQHFNPIFFRSADVVRGTLKKLGCGECSGPKFSVRNISTSQLDVQLKNCIFVKI